MNVVTLRDYAKQNNISYEAVRKQVVRYKKELDGHLIRDGRQQFLDEEAVAFLDAKRQKNPVAIIQMDKDETIEELKAQLDMAKNKIIDLQEQRDQLKDEKHVLELENAKIALLEAENGKKDETLEKERKTSQKLSDELTEARKQIEELKNASLMKRLFGWKKGE